VGSAVLFGEVGNGEHICYGSRHTVHGFRYTDMDGSNEKQ
jgi:hypothetical protein